MNGQSSYLQLMESLKTQQNLPKESEEKKLEFNNEYKESHPAQTELISWLANWRNQHGHVGKRKPLERDETIQQTQEVQPMTQRRRVVVRSRKLIDE